MERLVVRMAPETGALSSIRRVLRVAWDAAPSFDLETAALLLTEVVANALDHAHGTVSVSIEWHPHLTRFAVHDEGEAQPVLRNPGPAELRGRGMLLVDRLAAEWGVDLTGSGKWVWFDLHPENALLPA